jgi:hypothetical protein
MVTALYHFFSGGVMIGCFATALLFFRFYRRHADRFFAIFAAAFALLAVNRVVILMLTTHLESHSPAIYLIRLAAYLLILLAILQKNRASAGQSQRD